MSTTTLPFKVLSSSIIPVPSSRQPQMYELVDAADDVKTPNPARRTNHGKGVLDFIAHRPSLPLAVALGASSSLACFAFTLWLSQQTLTCPASAVHCEVSHAANLFRSRLGLVQGIVSTIYNLSITTIGYTIYQLAETTLWPMWRERSFTPPQVDQFLAHVRGSLSAFPYALKQARHRLHVLTVLIVGMFGILLHIGSSVIGYAYTLTPLETTMLSNHFIGGGIGLPFTQFNPPRYVPDEVSGANALYSAWSYSQSTEPLPELRNFIIDRCGFSQIGNFSVNAIEIKSNVNCSGMPINIYDRVYTESGGHGYYVNVSRVDNDNGNCVLPRLNPHLTAWVDTTWNMSNSRAVARVMFAILNGTIEGGYRNALNNATAEACRTWDWTCSGIDTLACDIDIDLVNGQACTDTCDDSITGVPYPTVSSVEALRGPGLATAYSASPREVWPISLWLASVVTTMGPYVFGYQPMWTPGSAQTIGSNETLPIAFSDMSSPTPAMYWSQATLMNFINVSIGALGMSIAGGWPLSPTPNVTVSSELPMERLNSSRAFPLLAPLGIALAILVLLIVLDIAMHRTANLLETRLCPLDEVFLRSQTPDLRRIVDDICNGREDRSRLEDMDLEFRELENGQDGLATARREQGF